jgi:hypothetical protein
MLIKKGSDDLFYPGILELLLRFVGFVPQLTFYIRHLTGFECDHLNLLNVYYICYLTITLLIICNQTFIVWISSLGDICDDTPRRHMSKLIYFRFLLTIVEMITTIIGIIWLTRIHYNGCSAFIYVIVLCNIVFSWMTIATILGVIFLFYDPLSNQADDDPNTKINKVAEHFKFFFCCCYYALYPKKEGRLKYKSSFKQISLLVEIVFRYGNMVPSDIGAGLILLNKNEVNFLIFANFLNLKLFLKMDSFRLINSIENSSLQLERISSKLLLNKIDSKHRIG